MEQQQIEKIIKLGKKHTYKKTEESYLDKIEKDLYKVIYEDISNENAIEVLAKLLFEREKYKESLTQFYKLLEINKDKIGAYYGLYKCYLMLNDFENSYKNIVEYIKNKENEKLNIGSRIIFSSYEVIFNNNHTFKVDDTNYFLMNQINDNDLKIKYSELIEAFNLENYQKCILLAEECEKICRMKNIKIEFVTFKQLLKKVNLVSKEFVKNNLYTTYKKLKKAVENEDYIKIIQILNNIPKGHLQDERLVYNSIYILIKNNYINEAKKIINMLIKTKNNVIIINVLEKAIKSQIEYNNLTNEEKEIYQTSIEQGHEYYKQGNLEYAYYTYTYGEYVTGNNIFLYYIGKILYKLKHYKEAEQYLKDYIRVGSDKISKAYLYLASIYKIKRKNKEAVYYSNLIGTLDKIFLTDFEVYYIHDKENQEIDSLKMMMQSKKYMYYDYYEEFGIDKKDNDNESNQKVKIIK